jgi:hypothetical protein
MKISAANATVVSATIALIGAISASALAQWSSIELENRRAKTEIVIELMKSNNKADMIEKIKILSATGLLFDENGVLLRAIEQAPSRTFAPIVTPVFAPCPRPEDVRPRPKKPTGKLPDDARSALALTLGWLVELEVWAGAAEAQLKECSAVS